MPPLFYLDSSALVKLVVAEHETAALRSYLGSDPTLTSSVLAAVEVPRAARRYRADAAAREVLEGVALIELSDDLARQAVMLEPPSLSSLDAIHLASALSLGEELEAFVGYDERLSEAVRVAGLEVAAPR